MTFTPVTLTGKYAAGATGAMAGTVTISLSQPMSNGGLILTPTAQIIDLDDTGAFSEPFFANTDPATIPQGSWYEVTEQLYLGSQGQQRDYSIQIPASLTFAYTFSLTTGNLPGQGLVTFNNVDYTSVTQVYMSEQSYSGPSIQNTFASLIGSHVLFANASVPEQNITFAVSNYSVSNGIVTLDVSYVSGNGSLDGYQGDLVFTAPITTIDISSLMPGTPMGFYNTGNPSGTVQWTTYLDLDEVVAWLQFTGAGVPDVGTAESGLLQRIIDSACSRAQTIANRPLCPTTYFERHDGWSGEYIQLNYSPFVKLVQCQEWQSTGGWVQLPESTPENPVEGIQINYLSSRIMRTFAGYSWPRPFFPGSRNIEVTYIAGFNPVPPDIWTATIDLVAYWWRNTQQAARGFKGSGSAAYGGAQSPDGLWPGIPNRISDVFKSYRMPVIG